MAERINAVKTSFFGKGAIRLLGPELQKMGIRRALLVTDRFLYDSGAAARVGQVLSDAGVEYAVYYNVQPNPTVQVVNDCIAAARTLQVQLLVALGGGSAIDTAKATSIVVACGGTVEQYEGENKSSKPGLPIVAVNTTAGTGSEVTPCAVITDQDTGVKYPLADYELMPKMAIVDADMMMNAPRGLTSASGIDAVTHDLEAIASMMATDYTDGLALQSLKMIFEYLPRAYTDGPNDAEAREKMANAATMAGMAFANAFLGVCHSMAHKLGAFHHLPHGVANALMIDEVLRFNAAEVPAKMGTFPQYDHPHTLSRYAMVADALGLGGKDDGEKLENLIRAIDDLKEKIGIKPTIRDYGIDENDFLNRLDEMVEQAFDDQCTGANPRYPLMKEIKQMYLRAYYGAEANK